MPKQPSGDGETSGAAPAEAVVTDSTHGVPEIFIDGYKNVTIHNLIVRVNLIANYPRLDKAEMETRLVGRLAMSVPAFLALYEGFGSLIREMEARGLISKTSDSND